MRLCRISAASLPAQETRLHAAFATGIRPPSGFELAFTDNPALRPERTRSFEAGREQKLLHRMLLIDGTYFYNRYYDLIVTLGGSLATLSHYQSDNLANSRAQGAEFTASLRPERWIEQLALWSPDVGAGTRDRIYEFSPGTFR